VVRFQRGARLAADGVAGPRTRRALGRRGRPALGARVLRRGRRGWDVAALQFLLAWRGFPSGPFDGGLGPRTEAALLRYQAWAGLVPDGVAGPATLRSLRRPPPRSPLALGRPVSAAIGDHFGPRGAAFHGGLDFVAPAGAPVVAARSGTVRFAGWDGGGYGWLVVLGHGAGVTTWYGHLSRLLVHRGEAVAFGALIGRVGATGRATGPHLHFEARLRGALTDPLLALR
jgi:murein DD-endopeptidase MepM/ murein hydrolase activator NlpD